MLTYCDVIDTIAGRQQLWRHNDRLFQRGFYGRFLSHLELKLITAQWATEKTSSFNLFQVIFFYFMTPVFQHGASLVLNESWLIC